MPNLQRGEIVAELGDQTWHLCLTLGALAELEGAFGADGLAGLARRFEDGAVSARDLLIIIGCGLRGAGHKISDAEVAQIRAPGVAAGYVRIVADLLAATFGAMASGKDEAARPPVPQDA
ncbi:MAG: gene transfer agent family protein [Hyphomicrobiales bacterium]|nr:gene transfer agent family protein [Hyphomicrobiales bacterium]